jgi:hypothetical protein
MELGERPGRDDGDRRAKARSRLMVEGARPSEVAIERIE